ARAQKPFAAGCGVRQWPGCSAVCAQEWNVASFRPKDHFFDAKTIRKAILPALRPSWDRLCDCIAASPETAHPSAIRVRITSTVDEGRATIEYEWLNGPPSGETFWRCLTLPLETRFAPWHLGTDVIHRGATPHEDGQATLIYPLRVQLGP